MGVKDSMGEIYRLNLPVSDSIIEKLKIGDIVYLTGIICTGRDHFHKRIISFAKNDKPLPEMFNYLKGSAIYHMGPIVKKTDDSYIIISGGPTTSARMNPFQTEVSKILQNKFVIGKGGMDEVNWKDIPAVYLQYPGGAGAIVGKFITAVKKVEWLDLGTPEAAWFLEVNEFGPLVVSIDLYGGNLYKR